MRKIFILAAFFYMLIQQSAIAKTSPDAIKNESKIKSLLTALYADSPNKFLYGEFNGKYNRDKYCSYIKGYFTTSKSKSEIAANPCNLEVHIAEDFRYGNLSGEDVRFGYIRYAPVIYPPRFNGKKAVATAIAAYQGDKRAPKFYYWVDFYLENTQLGWRIYRVEYGPTDGPVADKSKPPVRDSENPFEAADGRALSP